MPDSPASTSFLTQKVTHTSTSARSAAAAVTPQMGFKRITSVSVVVPCCNEADALANLKNLMAPLLDNLHRDGYQVEIVLVDDGSRDATYAMMLDLFPCTGDVPVKIVRHEQNQGLASALRSASRVVTGDVVCTLDADCTYPPNDMYALLTTMVRTGADVVTGSPYHPDGGVENVQGWRLALSRSASRIYGTLLRERLYCYTSMFRVYSRDWFRADFITSDHFVGVTELLVRAVLSGARVVEHPVVLRRRVYGVSKLRVGRTMWQHFKFMGRIAASQFRLTERL